MKKIIFSLLFFGIFNANSQIFIEGKIIPDTVEILAVYTNSSGVGAVTVDYGQIQGLFGGLKNRLTDKTGNKIRFRSLPSIIVYFERNGFVFEDAFSNSSDNGGNTTVLIFRRAEPKKFTEIIEH